MLTQQPLPVQAVYKPFAPRLPDSIQTPAPTPSPPAGRASSKEAQAAAQPRYSPDSCITPPAGLASSEEAQAAAALAAADAANPLVRMESGEFGARLGASPRVSAGGAPGAAAPYRLPLYLQVGLGRHAVGVPAC
jgi:hypothetical protein